MPRAEDTPVIHTKAGPPTDNFTLGGAAELAFRRNFNQSGQEGLYVAEFDEPGLYLSGVRASIADVENTEEILDEWDAAISFGILTGLPPFDTPYVNLAVPQGTAIGGIGFSFIHPAWNNWAIGFAWAVRFFGQTTTVNGTLWSVKLSDLPRYFEYWDLDGDGVTSPADLNLGDFLTNGWA